MKCSSRIAAIIVPALFGMAAIYLFAAIQHEIDQRHISMLGEQRVLVQHLARDLTEVASAGEAALDRFAVSHEQFARRLEILKKGDAETNLPPIPDELRGELEAVSRAWQTFDSATGVIGERRTLIGDLHRYANLVNERSGLLLRLSDEIATKMAEGGESSSTQIYIATRQVMLGQRIVNNVRHMTKGSEGARIAFDRVSRDAALFRRTIDGFLNGNRGMGIEQLSPGEARFKLEEVNSAFKEIEERVGAFGERHSELGKLNDVHALLKVNAKLAEAMDKLERAYQGYASSRSIGSSLGTAFFMIAGVSS